MGGFYVGKLALGLGQEELGRVASTVGSYQWVGAVVGRGGKKPITRESGASSHFLAPALIMCDQRKPTRAV